MNETIMTDQENMKGRENMTDRERVEDFRQRWHAVNRVVAELEHSNEEVIMNRRLILYNSFHFGNFLKISEPSLRMLEDLFHRSVKAEKPGESFDFFQQIEHILHESTQLKRYAGRVTHNQVGEPPWKEVRKDIEKQYSKNRVNTLKRAREVFRHRVKGIAKEICGVLEDGVELWTEVILGLRDPADLSKMMKKKTPPLLESVT